MLDEVYLQTGVGQVECGSHPSNAAADDQSRGRPGSDWMCTDHSITPNGDVVNAGTAVYKIVL